MSPANNDDSVIQWQLMLCCGFGKTLEQERDFGKYGWAMVNNEISFAWQTVRPLGRAMSRSGRQRRGPGSSHSPSLTRTDSTASERGAPAPVAGSGVDLTAWDRGAAPCGRKGGAPSGNPDPASVRGMGEMMGTTPPVSHGLDTWTGTFLIDPPPGEGGSACGGQKGRWRLQGCGRANYLPPPTLPHIGPS